MFSQDTTDESQNNRIIITTKTKPSDDLSVEVKTNYYDDIKSKTGTKSQLESLQNITSSRSIDKKQSILHSRTNNDDIIHSQKTKQIYHENDPRYVINQRTSHENI